MTAFIRTITVPLMLIAALGFGMSAYAHVLALRGQPFPWGESVWFLHVGIFVVWIPAAWVSQRVVRGSAQKNFWKIALLGCPPWMRAAVYALFGYAILNFILFAVTSDKTHHPAGPSEVRGFSGHWLLFYGAGYAILYSARARPDLLDGIKCPNGHDVDPMAHYCAVCGAPVQGIRLDT